MFKVNEEIDANNIAIFYERGVDDAAEMRHRCVICGKPTCIADSCSRQGERLICMTCFHTKVDDKNAFLRWICRTDEEKK